MLYEITLEEEAGGDYTSYPTKIHVDHQEEMNDDFSDIDFPDHDFALAEKEDGDYAVFVVVLDWTAGETKTIEMESEVEDGEHWVDDETLVDWVDTWAEENGFGKMYETSAYTTSCDTDAHRIEGTVPSWAEPAFIRAGDYARHRAYGGEAEINEEDTIPWASSDMCVGEATGEYIYGEKAGIYNVESRDSVSWVKDGSTTNTVDYGHYQSSNHSLYVVHIPSTEPSAEVNEAFNVETLEAEDITFDSATLNGKYENEEEADVWFRWKKQDDEDWQETEKETLEGKFDYTLKDLSFDTTYEFKAVGLADGTEVTGDVHQFTTLSPEVSVETKEATEVSYDKAVLNGEVEEIIGIDQVQAYFKYRPVGVD